MSPRPDDARRLRIAICLSQFHPTIGGAEGQMLQLARRWAGQGHRPLVITRRVRGLPGRENVDGLEIRRVIRTLELGPLFGLSFLGTLVASLVRFARRYDVVVAAQAPWEAVATGWICRRLGKPSVARLASIGPLGDLAQLNQAKGSRLWRRWVLANSCFLAASATAREEWLAMGCPAERIRPMTNGVDLERFGPADEMATRAAGQVDRARTVLFVGRLAAAKNPLAVLRAWKRLNCQGQYRLLMAGDGPLADTLLAYQRQEALRNVEFLGQTSDMPAVYRKAAVCVQPSPHEGCSNALLEAMAGGLCPVVSRVPGNVDLVEDGVNGLTFPVDDDEALAAALARVLDNEALRKRLGAAARRHVAQRHDLDQIAAAHIALFQELLDRSQP